MLASSTPGERCFSQPAAVQLDAFYRALWQNSDICMYALDVVDKTTFRYAAFNDAIVSALSGKSSILGQMPIAQLVGRSLDECLIREVADRYRQHYSRCLEQRSAIAFEKSFSTRRYSDRSDYQYSEYQYSEQYLDRYPEQYLNRSKPDWPGYICWRLTVYPLMDKTETVAQLLVMVTDITAQKRSEEALSSTRQVWQQVIDTVPSAIFWKDRQSRYLGCNRGFLKIAGLETVADILGKDDYDMVWKPEEAEWFRECDRRVIDSNQPELNIIEPQLQAGGRQAWVRTSKVPLHNEQGEVTGVLGVVEDITDRKETKDREDRLLAILEATPDIVGITDALGNHHYLNRAGKEIFGVSLEETKSFHISRITHPDVADRLTKEALPTAMKKGIWHGESLVRDSMGNSIPVSQVLICHRAEDGCVAYFSSIMRDISDRKAAEAVLKETAERQEVLNSITSQVRNSLDIDTVIGTALIAIHQGLKLDYSGFAWIYLGDELSWKIVQALDESDRAIAYGEGPSDRLGPDLNQLAKLTISQIDDAERCEDLAYQDFLNRLGIKSEILVPFQADEQKVGVIIGHHVHQPHCWNEEELELLVAVSDQLAIAISQADLYAQSCRQSQEVARTLEQLQKTQAQIIQAEKMSSLGQMVAGVAHEINNPVNFIYGNIDPAQEYIKDLLGVVDLYRKTYPDAPPELQAEIEAVDLEFIQADLPKLLESMAVGTNRIREIVLSLRNFSRLDEAAVKTVDLHEGIDSTLVILSHKLKGNSKNKAIELEKRYGEMPEVGCYPSQLNQVFMNILANALDALEEHASPKICISTERQNDFAIIRIADNGPGIPIEVQPQILDPFFTTKPVGKGTGMGMSISYQIITEKHGGKLSFTSEVGKGTEFVIEIPLEQPDIE